MVNVTSLGYFVGEYRHSLTERNRVALPKRFRVEIEGSEVILAKGEERCIEGFDKTQWKEMVKQYVGVPFTSEEGRKLRKRVFSSAMLVEVDSQGRVVLPDQLLSWAGLKGKVGEELFVIGVGDHFEIWEKAKWEEPQNSI